MKVQAVERGQIPRFTVSLLQLIITVTDFHQDKRLCIRASPTASSNCTLAAPTWGWILHDA